MNRQSLRDEIAALDVFDTHTHLVGGSLAARTFWDIAEYFWFAEELWAAGYPKDAGNLPEGERIDAFVKAFDATRNTSMNWVVRRIFADLYGIEIADAASISKADEAVKATAVQPDWPATVAAKTRVRRMVVNFSDDADFADLPGASVLVPRIEAQIDDWLTAVSEASDQRAAGDDVLLDIHGRLAGFRANGCPGIMFALERMALRAHGSGGSLKKHGNTRDEALVWLLHRIAEVAEANGLFIQLFLGVEGDWNDFGFASANDPERILKLHGLFESHACDFEIVLASEINTLDAVQAARTFPNVYVGGQWWFNFRASTYRDSMQKCLEALPPSKRSLVASDARCVEWVYGKIALVKRLLADFLYDQIELGWLDREQALRVAREWLHDSASRKHERTKARTGMGSGAFATSTAIRGIRDLRT